MQRNTMYPAHRAETAGTTTMELEMPWQQVFATALPMTDAASACLRF